MAKRKMPLLRQNMPILHARGKRVASAVGMGFRKGLKQT
jgi:hypothetical protein